MHPYEYAYSDQGRASHPARRRPFSLLRGFFSLLLAGLFAFGLLRLLQASGAAPALDSILPPAAPAAGYQQLQMTQADMGKGDLILINRDHPISQMPELTLTQLMNEQSIDSYCYPQLQEMMDGCRAEGLSPMICSSFRSQEKQEALFSAKVSEYLEQGYGSDRAKELAGSLVAVPGTSEHQLGRAVDICTQDNQNLDESQLESPVQQWMMANCADYGFILRYGQDKSELTGILYEPWHYRFVGQPHARYIMDNGLCLEEYIQLLKSYSYDGPHLNLDCPEGSFEAYYCPGLNVYVPEGRSYSISGNNEDGFIVTLEGHAAVAPTAPGSSPDTAPSTAPSAVPSDGSAIAPPKISG